jgi:opacity protein-like surface antigen
MRRTIKLVTFAVILAVFAAPALAQSKECNDENKAAWYGTFLENFRGDPAKQKIAYDAAKLYLTSCPEDPADAQAAYMKNKFVIPYEKIKGDADVAKQLEGAINSKNYAEQMRLGKLVLSGDPDNTKVYIILGVVGLNDPSLLSDSAQYAKKAVEMIEAGKPFAPLFDGSRDRALAQLNYAMAKAKLSSAPTEALPYLIKAARYDSDLKKNPQTFLEIGTAYEKGPRAKLTEEYEAKYKGHDETPESKLVAANIDQMIDRQIDALARGVAVATNAADKKALMDELTTLYKYRNKSDAGLNELVAGILSKPLPDVPAPITSLPTPTPASTPTTPSGRNGTTSGSASANGQTKTGATGATGAQNGNKTTSGAKPGSTPTPSNKPKPRRANHRRG